MLATDTFMSHYLCSYIVTVQNVLKIFVHLERKTSWLSLAYIEGFRTEWYVLTIIISLKRYTIVIGNPWYACHWYIYVLLSLSLHFYFPTFCSVDYRPDSASRKLYSRPLLHSGLQSAQPHLTVVRWLLSIWSLLPSGYWQPSALSCRYLPAQHWSDIRPGLLGLSWWLLLWHTWHEQLHRWGLSAGNERLVGSYCLGSLISLMWSKDTDDSSWLWELSDLENMSISTFSRGEGRKEWGRGGREERGGTGLWTLWEQFPCLGPCEEGWGGGMRKGIRKAVIFFFSLLWLAKCKAFRQQQWKHTVYNDWWTEHATSGAVCWKWLGSLFTRSSRYLPESWRFIYCRT